MSDEATRALQLRGALELFLASDGDAYLLRGGSGREHVIRQPDARDRALLRQLADGVVPVRASSEAQQRLRPLVEAGAVVEAPDARALGPVDAERFDRQLPYLEDLADDPVELQRRVRAAKVAILGCGGLGTWAIGAVASLGVGGFVLIDDDRVELSNLNRQILYTAGDVGAVKVERAAAWIRRFDPAITVETHRRRVEGPDDLAAIADCDVMLLLADWPPYDLNRWANTAALTHAVPYMVAGQQPPLVRIGPTVIPRASACFACHERQLRAEYPYYDELAAQRMQAPPAATTLGPASGVVGAMLAMEVLHLLAGGHAVTTQDRVLTFDLRTWQARSHTIERDPDCPACGT